MKKMTTPLRNAGTILLELSPEAQNEFKKKLLTALQKFSSSKKTRAVHKLIESDAIGLGMFSGTMADLLFAMYFKTNTLGKIVLNIALFDDSLDTVGSTNHAQKIKNLEEDIAKEKTFIKEEQLKNLEELNKRKKEEEEKFLNSLDYLKMIDGIYFSWLNFLSIYIVTSKTDMLPKIATTASDILAEIIKKIFAKANKKIDPEVHQLIEACAYYFIRVYFYGESSSYAINKIKKGFKPEVIESIEMSKVTKFKEFEDLGTLLKETGLIAMTPNTFRLQMENFFGKYGYQYYMSTSFTSFISFLANLAHPTQLFKDSYPVNDTSHKRLEELILNAQKSTMIKTQKIT
jgi:hypothetical protein